MVASGVFSSWVTVDTNSERISDSLALEMTARAVIATLARSASAAPTTNHNVSRGPLDISWAAALRSALTRMVHGRITRLRGSCSASGDSANSSGSGRLAPCCTGRPVTEVPLSSTTSTSMATPRLTIGITCATISVK